MKRLLTLLSMMLAVLLIVGACGNDEEVGKEEQAAEDPADEKAEEMMTIGGMEETPFEEIEGEHAVKMHPADWEDPYDLEQLRYELYYGDQEFIAMPLNDGIFRYDAAEDEVVWEIDNRSAGSMMYDGQLYVKQLVDSTPASISVVNLEDGSAKTVFEEESHRNVVDLYFLDDLMLFSAPPYDREDQEKDLIVYDLDTDSKFWDTPVYGLHGLHPLDIGDYLLFVNDYGKGDESYAEADTAYAYDKETGEEAFEIQADSSGKMPLANEKGIYFVDGSDDVIQLYDFDGNKKEELQLAVGIHPNETTPVVTDESVIFADLDGIVWYEPDLSGEQQRVEFGESDIRHLHGTDDRLYAVVSEDSDEEGDAFYVVSIDLETGEVYGKVAIETADNTLHAMHIYNNKFHFAVNDPESGEEIYYVFSGEDVNKPFNE